MTNNSNGNSLNSGQELPENINIEYPSSISGQYNNSNGSNNTNGSNGNNMSVFKNSNNTNGS